MTSAVRPDAVTDEYFVWIKACSRLRLTNQLRSAVAAAVANDRRVLLVIRPYCVLSEDLDRFIAASGVVDVRKMS